ncbi:MAG: ABC transporter permease subunit [Candidatus Jordarchaeales archaeon]|nr:ABC transporter permease subunit [Candidatus Jordarchaeia archaeon]
MLRGKLRVLVLKADEALSAKPVRLIGYSLIFILVSFVVFAPIFYIFYYTWRWWSYSPYTYDFTEGVQYQFFYSTANVNKNFVESLINSLLVAATVTVIGLGVGIPIGFFLARKRVQGITILDTLTNVPLIVPSSALGFAVYLLWGSSKGLSLVAPGLWLIILTHAVFTSPYVIRSVHAQLLNYDISLEEAARVLGASPLKAFTTVTLPVIKPGVISGAILAFTRSLGETGATLVVMGPVQTVPVLIVDLVEQHLWPAAAFSASILMLISFVFTIIFKYLATRTY